MAEVINISSIGTQLASNTFNNVSGLVQDSLAKTLAPLMPIFKVVGIVVIVYIIFLIIKAISGIRLNKKISNIAKNVEQINSKLDLLVKKKK